MQVVGHAEDRIRGVPAIDRAIAVAVHPIPAPGRCEELRRPARAGRVRRPLLRTRRVRIAPVIALHLADAGQYRPVQSISRGRPHVELEIFRWYFHLCSRRRSVRSATGACRGAPRKAQRDAEHPGGRHKDSQGRPNHEKQPPERSQGQACRSSPLTCRSSVPMHRSSPLSHRPRAQLSGPRPDRSGPHPN